MKFDRSQMQYSNTEISVSDLLPLGESEPNMGKVFINVAFKGAGAVLMSGCIHQNSVFLSTGDIIPIPDKTTIISIPAFVKCTFVNCTFNQMAFLVCKNEINQWVESGLFSIAEDLKPTLTIIK